MQGGPAVVGIGSVIAGRYHVDSRLGEGGYGVVYVATQTNLGRQVALKVLHPEIIQRGDALARFEREAKLAQQLSHPNVVRIFDFGRTDDQVPFIVFELLVGRPLERDIAERGAMPEARVSHIAQQTLKGLMQAHGLGIVHRDIKPANIFLCDFDGEPDFVKVLDFGIAAGPAEKQEGAKLTAQGISLGTPAYMAPEQVMAQSVDGRADQYALGLVMSEMLTGAAVYAGTSAMHTALRQIEAAPVPLPPEVMASSLGHVIARATQKDPNARYGSALEMLDALRALAKGSGPQPTLSRPASGPVTVPDLATSATVAVPTPARPTASAVGETLMSAQHGAPAASYPPTAATPAPFGAPAHGPNASISAQMFAPPPPPSPAAAKKSSATVWIVGILALVLLGGGGLASQYLGEPMFGGKSSKKSASSKKGSSSKSSKSDAKKSAAHDAESHDDAESSATPDPPAEEPAETPETPEVAEPPGDVPGGASGCLPLPSQLNGVFIKGVKPETILQRLETGGYQCKSRESIDIEGRNVETFSLEKGDVQITVQLAPISMAQPAEDAMFPVTDPSSGWAVTFMGNDAKGVSAIVFGQQP